MKNIPIISYLARYWLIVVLLAGASLLLLNERIFQALGTLIYPPALVIEGLAVALLLRHIFFRSTLDQDAHTGDFIKYWQEALTPRERVLANLAMTAALFLGTCWIVAAVAK